MRVDRYHRDGKPVTRFTKRQDNQTISIVVPGHIGIDDVVGCTDPITVELRTHEGARGQSRIGELEPERATELIQQIQQMN